MRRENDEGFGNVSSVPSEYIWTGRRGDVNRFMADVALETVQRMLSAVSEEMRRLSEHVTRFAGEEFKEEARRGEVTEPPPSSSAASLLLRLLRHRRR